MRSRVLALFVVTIFTAVVAAAERGPNVVFIFADDMGWGDLSCHGNTVNQTPNIDRLAAEGIDFQRFEVCNPVCSPSRTAALTGRFPARFSVHQHFAQHDLNMQRGMPDWLDPQAVTVAKLFKTAGYKTGHFGKWHLTHETIPDAPPPSEYGFDEWAVFNGPPPRIKHGDVANEAVRFIERNKNQPFYLNVWLHETHTPHFPSEQVLAKYDGLDEQHRVYAAVMEAADRKVAKILESLRDLGLEQNTLVVFSSDNGPEWTGSPIAKKQGAGLGTYYSVGQTGERRGRKRSLFEGGISVPFIVRWPGKTPAGGKDETTNIAGVDLLPTFCAAAGIALPADYQSDGENMLAAWKGSPAQRTAPLFWEWRGLDDDPDWWPRIAVRQDDWKLVVGANEKRIELYNLREDLQERTDLAKSEPQRVASMLRLANDWRKTLPTQAPSDCISTKLNETNRQKRSDQPNILFILADDQRCDTIRALGNTEINTPNLDRLAESGFHFNNAYCMGSMSPAVCVPSRTMLLTGRSVWHLPKVEGLEAPPDLVLLPRVLHDAGYVTYHCGKANNACRYGNAAFDRNIETEKSGPDDMRLHADRVVQFLRQHDKSRPFFIYLAPPVPHDPRVAPEKFVRMYDPNKLSLSRNFMPEHPFDNGELKIRDEKLADWPRTPEAMRQQLADYYACISDLDDQVGRVTRELSELDYAKKTIIIYSSDQGLAVGGRHGLMGKQNLYEHVKPPLIFSGPGIPHGESNALVYLYDLFPTICEYAKAQTPEVVEGESLAPIMYGDSDHVRPYLFTAYRDWQRMIRDDRWKLIEYFVNGARHTQLFDLSTDPDEMNDLSSRDQSAGTLSRLRSELQRMGASFEDPDVALYSNASAAPAGK